MDVRGGRTYLDGEMMRQFLALVAILTGLTTLAAPAQARFSVLDDVRVQVAGESAAASQSARAAAAVRPASPLTGASDPAPAPRLVPAFTAPAVILQADRAHE